MDRKTRIAVLTAALSALATAIGCLADAVPAIDTVKTAWKFFKPTDPVPPVRVATPTEDKEKVQPAAVNGSAQIECTEAGCAPAEISRTGRFVVHGAIRGKHIEIVATPNPALCADASRSAGNVRMFLEHPFVPCRSNSNCVQHVSAIPGPCTTDFLPPLNITLNNTDETEISGGIQGMPDGVRFTISAGLSPLKDVQNTEKSVRKSSR